MVRADVASCPFFTLFCVASSARVAAKGELTHLDGGAPLKLAAVNSTKCMKNSKKFCG